MNNKLSRLNQVNVSTYLTDLKPGVGELNTQGALVVLDNTGDPNIQNLISSNYGFFIDDVFIAGGYGFKSLQEYKDFSKSVNKINDISAYTYYLANKIDQQEFTFDFTYSSDSNIMSPEYNAYGFICSYKFFKLSYTNNSYILNLSNQVNINYLNKIEIIPLTNTELDYEDNSTNGRFEYKVKLNYNNGSINTNYNNGIKIYSNNELITNSEQTLYITKPSGKYLADINIDIKNSKGESIYTYNIDNIAKWVGKLSYNPNKISNNSTNYNIWESSNYVNFRDSNFDWNNSDSLVAAQINTLLDLIDNSKSKKYTFEFEKEIEIPFSAGDNPLYDYIVTTKPYKIEFFFNGIQSYNWNMKKHGDDYIYQSPQKYIGKHTWVLKIYPTI